MSEPTRPRVGLAGYGYWGPNLARVLRRSDGGDLVAVCDPDPARLHAAADEHPGLQRFARYDDLLAVVDAVVLATPLATHATLALEALRRGRHVLVEKPLCGSLAEARALLAAAHQAGRVLAVGHTYLHSPAVQFIGRELRSGRLGRLCYIRSSRLNPAGYRADANVLWDLAVHDLAILQSWLRAAPLAVQVMARGRTALAAPEVALIQLRYPDDVLVQLEVSRLAPCKQRSMELVGSRRRVLFDDLRSFDKVRLFPAEPGLGFDAAALDAAALRRGALPGDIVVPHLAGSEPLQAEVDDFLSAVSSGGVCRGAAQHALEVVRTLERLQQACDGVPDRPPRRGVQPMRMAVVPPRGVTIPITSSPCFAGAFSRLGVDGLAAPARSPGDDT